jgi:hypothetical protein
MRWVGHKHAERDKKYIQNFNWMAPREEITREA